MKMNIGGSLGVTINLGDFENVKVETSFSIEKDIDEDQIQEEQEKVTTVLQKDLENKVKKSVKHVNDFKKNLKKINNS